jgi:hypothetical protein
MEKTPEGRWRLLKRHPAPNGGFSMTGPALPIKSKIADFFR